MGKLKAGWGAFWLGVCNLKDEALLLVVTLGAVMFTRLWPAVLALWSGLSPAAAPWPSLWTLIPGLFFAIVILAIDASRGTKESRAARLFPRMVALVLQGLGVQTLIDQLDRMIRGGGG